METIPTHPSGNPDFLASPGKHSVNPSVEIPTKSSKTSDSNGVGRATRASSEGTKASNTSSGRFKSSVTKPAVGSDAMTKRRNSTGGLSQKLTISAQKRLETTSSFGGRKVVAPVVEPGKRSGLESRRTLSTSTKSSVDEAKDRLSRSSSRLDSKMGSERKLPVKSSLTSSVSKKFSMSPSSSNGRSTSRMTTTNISSPSTHSPSVTSSLKMRSLSSSGGKGSGPLGRGKVSTPDSRDSRLIMLPQIEVKAGDDLRMDLRGHRVHSLTARGLNLSPNLEFLYLRDNLLSSLEGIETLKRVKVLDLSFNDFKGSGFEPLENCKSLQQLYLAGNHITSLASLPELPNLEFLSVAQNRLKSLRMASQPRLQVLAASKNRIYTLKGFPHFPVLEHLRVEENPILDMPHIEAASILLVGPTLKKFNDRDLSPQELECAAQYPAHTALCIRDGWEFCQPDLASESTFSFLLERWKDHLPPGFILKEASVDKPFEGDACYSHFVFSSDGGQNNESELTLRYQWFIGDKISTQFSSIRDATSEVYWPKHEDVGKFLKVECTPIFEGMAYPSIFAVSAVVCRGTGCPKILNLEVDGILVEGNVIKGCFKVAWCGGTPGKGVSSWLRRKWNSSSEVIAGADDQEYRLTIDDIGSSLVYMYTAVTEEGVKGEPQYAMTDFVRPASPAVHNVKIIGDAVEGNAIRGIGEYFGGKEGPSKFEWSRQNRETGDLILVCDGTTDYTLTKEDIGWRMAFAYIPTNFEGQEGMAVSAITETVRKAPPQASSLVLVGDLKEGSKVAVTASVLNGTEGSSRVQWFKSNSSLLDDESSLEAVSASKVAKAFRIPLGVVGYYLVAKFTPMAPDGESGEPAFVISQKPVETLPPSLNFLSVTGDYVEGEMLTASYGYIGGHEGKSLYAWYLHENEIDRGTLIQEALGLLQYRITKESMDKFISFQCTPIRDDGVVGGPSIYRASERVRPGSPRLLSLKILGDATEGTKLFADKKYWGGEEGNSVFRWFLTSNDGKMSEIKGATGVYCILPYEDIGFMVSVSCEPVRNDGARGPVVISDPVGPVSPGHPVCKSLDICGSLIEGERMTFTAAYAGGEKGNCLHEWFRVKRNRFRERLTNFDYLDLTLLDVGMSIELVYTPIRKDGLRGPSVTCVSTVIHPADPKGIQLMIPDCYEDQEVVPQKSYYGGEEGSGEYTWYRTTRKLDEMELLKISDKCENAVVVGKHMTYTPSIEDVDSYLILCWVPTRADGKRGNPVVAISSPVLPAFPNVPNVCVKALSIGTYAGEGTYYGGHEGSSLYSWYRETHEGTITLISGADSMTYDVTDLDYNCRLIFGYTPVRSDSVVGEQRLSEHTNIILPEHPQIEMLSFTGKPVEGETLKAVEVIPNVLSKYKKEAIYQWSYSTVEDFQSFEILPSQCSGSYKLRLEDTGRFLKCECFVMDVFGRSSEVVSAVTGPISPGIPKIDKLEIEGRGYHTNLYAVRGSYSGGKEGKSKIQWLRSMAGSPDLISISGEVGRMYEANVDDVGYRLVVVYTPVREDGEEGQAVSAATETISVEPDVYKEVKQKIDLGSVKFEVLCDKEPAQKKVNGAANLERRILEVNKKRVKVIKPGSKASFPATETRGTYAPPFHVELYRRDQHRFKIVVDGENEVELMVQTRYMRDIIVLVIRGFAQRFNSTSLNSLLKIES